MITACAHQSQEQTIDDLTPSQINSIAMMAKTSYARGCIDGMNMLVKKKTYGKRLEACKLKSIDHYAEIKHILKLETKPTGAQESAQ